MQPCKECGAIISITVRVLLLLIHPPDPCLHQVLLCWRRTYAGITLHIVPRAHIPGVLQHAYRLILALPLTLEQVGVEGAEVILYKDGYVLRSGYAHGAVIGELYPSALSKC